MAQLTPLPVGVLNSHTHGDHIGANHQFESIYGTDTEFTRQNARGKLEPSAESAGEEKRYRIRPFTVSETVRDRQKIDLGGRIVEVLLTPGHTPDALCLLDRKNRILFTGDTFYLGKLYAHLEHSNFNRYYKTAFRLGSLAPRVDYVLPAHLVTLVRGDFLRRLHLGFKSILEARARSIAVEPGVRAFVFRDFSVLVRERDARRFVPLREPEAPAELRGNDPPPL